MVYSTRKPTIKIAGAAVLAALAGVMQSLPPLFLTPWFMRIDFVAIPWVLCWLLFGFDAAFVSMLLSLPIVGFVGPFAGGVVGMTMKPVASVWMFAIPALLVWKTGGSRSFVMDKRIFVIGGALALLVRAAVTILFNFYFALPVFYGMAPTQIIDFFDYFKSFVGQSLGLVGFGLFAAEVAVWNTIQGIVDIYAAYLIGLVVQRRISVVPKAMSNIK